MAYPASYYEAVSQSAPYQWWRLNDAVGSTTAVNQVTASNSGVIYGGSNNFVFISSSSSSLLSGPDPNSLYQWYTQQTNTVKYTGATTVNIPSSSIVCSGAVSADDMELYTPWTVEMWVRINPAGETFQLCGKMSSSANRGWYVYSSTSPTIMYFAVYYTSGSATGTQSSTSINWRPSITGIYAYRHICFVSNPTSSVASQLTYVKCFIDGQEIPKNNDGGIIPASSSMKHSGAFTIGGTVGGGQQQGLHSWSDFAIYNRALSSDEIFRHYQSSFSQFSSTVSGGTNMCSGTIPTGTFEQITPVNPSTKSVYLVKYSTPSSGSGTRGRRTKTNPGSN